MRAAFKNAASGETVQGGSTLTMQLVRNLYSGNRARSGLAGYKRKIREAKLASELEDRHPGARGKRWILTQYLNNVPYGTVGGQTAVGIQSASRIFFGKPASRLTLPEAALLAGLPQAPSNYNPFLDPGAARARRSEVLDQMRRSGYITADQEAAARRAPLGVKRSAYYAKRRESYFFDYVRTELIKKYGVGPRARRRAQGLHDDQPEDAAGRAQRDRRPPPESGRPLVGAREHGPARPGTSRRWRPPGTTRRSKFNLAAQGRRQPGSTFKVMVLMAALRQGVDIRKTTYDSKPLNFTDPIYGKIEVNTDDRPLRGSVPIFNALVASDNTVFQQLDLDVGPDQVRQTAYDMGITSKLNAFPAEGLGGLRIGVSPLEMTRAYVTINNGGWRVRPVAITKVVFPGGREDTSLGKTRRVKIFTDGQTYEATKALEANVQRGTGTAAAARLPRRRQDRHDERLHRRLVRRVHELTEHRRLGRLPGHDPVDERGARLRGDVRRQGARVDLERLHGDGHAGSSVQRVPRAQGTVRGQAVLRQVRLDRHPRRRVRRALRGRRRGDRHHRGRQDEGRGGQEVPAQSVRVPAAARPDARAPGGRRREQESAPVNPTGGVGIG